METVVRINLLAFNNYWVLDTLWVWLTLPVCAGVLEMSFNALEGHWLITHL